MKYYKYNYYTNIKEIQFSFFYNNVLKIVNWFLKNIIFNYTDLKELNMAKQLKAIKCPSDELSLTNCAIVNPREFEKVR